MLLVKPRRWFSLVDLGLGANLKHLKLSDGQVHLAGSLTGGDGAPAELMLESAERTWHWPIQARADHMGFEGYLPAEELGEELLVSVRQGDLQRPWLAIRVLKASQAELEHWQDFFAGRRPELPGADLERICHCALLTTTVKRCDDRPAALAEFCDRAASQQLVVEAAQLRHQGQFPSVLGQGPGRILASRLVRHLNLLLIQEGRQRFVVFQGVSSSDGVLLPGLDLLLLVCHLEADTVLACLRLLSRTPEFFTPSQPVHFGGYLVGHYRPAHCFYDGLLALSAVREAKELQPGDALFSREGEAFVDLGRCLELPQPHQQHSQEALNNLTVGNSTYLLQLGLWFGTQAENPELRQLAAAVDGPLRAAARRDSHLAAIGALEKLEACTPLIWVGITGQKRCWVEQVEGTAALLNSLQQEYPRLGVIFDGWTPPLTSSDDHRREARKDDRVIRRILKRLTFKSRNRVGVIVGLPLLEKVRVGLGVDAFVANYTTGSLNVARICARPGVGHMGQRMAASKHQHIHHLTREIDPQLVHDVVELSDTSTPAWSVSYSLPWQAVYSQLTKVLNEAMDLREKR
jgi:hypothetical protein